MGIGFKMKTLKHTIVGMITLALSISILYGLCKGLSYLADTVGGFLNLYIGLCILAIIYLVLDVCREIGSNVLERK